VGTREVSLLALALVIGVIVRLAYVVLFRHAALAGDEVEFSAEGLDISRGLFFYTRLPYGILHAGAWKAPGYPLWVGLWYSIVGVHPTVVRLVQIPLGATVILLTWVLARRLFGSRVAAIAALVVAVYPLAWQYEELLYPESFATPLALALLILAFTRTPTARRAVLFGLVLGVALYFRATSEIFIVPALVAWCLRTSWRRGLVLAVVAGLTAVVVVAPWTIRNAIVMHGFVPISMESGAAYGTFNPQSATNPFGPWAWQPDPKSDADLYNKQHPLSDVTLLSRLEHRAISYVEAHPSSLLKAFYWNGITRFWDLRPRSRSLAEVPYEGRSRLVTSLGLDMYDVLLPLSIVGLWLARRRRWLVWAILAFGLTASIIFTLDAGTRYRVPLEPLITVFACYGAVGIWQAARKRYPQTLAEPV
jgi:4-amino-4-deoxy-L-arabinose transferase-like glycosyltransferase